MIEDVTAESAGLGILVGQSETRGAIAVPVGRGFPVAAVAVYRKQPHRPVGHELELLTALADVTALMLERTGVAGGNLNLETGATERHEVSAEPEAVARLLAHDLRNPLWQIRGFAEHLQDDHAPALGETGRSTLEHLLRASDELGHVIEGLIELAEISSAPLSPRLLDLGAAARDVAATLSIASGRAVEWRIDDGPLAHADPELLRILLEKLLSNALRNTRSRDIALVEVGAIASAGAFTTFFVRDNGVGFGPADRSRLFAPFQRHHSREEAPPGAGTGLAIVRRIVGRHGGEVWAEGAPDAGAAFYFTLPAPR